MISKCVYINFIYYIYYIYEYLFRLFRKSAPARGGFPVNVDEEHYDRMLFAFTNVYDALNFCLDAQVNLMKVEWPPALYEHADASKET